MKHKLPRTGKDESSQISKKLKQDTMENNNFSSIDHFTSEEYELLAQNTKKLTPDFRSGKLAGNLEKNRYNDIMALEPTRVKIPITCGYNSTDYINANLVHTERLKFICTQSPLIRTFPDFWLMVWDKNCQVIVALNRLVENNTVKGDKYWPDKEKKIMIGALTVELIATFNIKDLDITIRRLSLYYKESQREIYHMHYEGWPDFGVPENSMAIRELVRYSHYFQKITSSGPIVVHCSAGIGRSGSFMAIASIMSNPIFDKPSQSGMDKPKILSILSLREKRHPGIVQTQQQYNFIYKALMDELSHPTTFSEGLKKVEHWSKSILKKERLTKSGPSYKCYRDDYGKYLADNTSNDLNYILNRGREKKKNNDFIDNDILERKEKRSFLSKSYPSMEMRSV